MSSTGSIHLGEIKTSTNDDNSNFSEMVNGHFKAPTHLVVHDNLKTFPKYSERSVHNLKGLPQLSVLFALEH